jgi:hypothetical protein
VRPTHILSIRTTSCRCCCSPCRGLSPLIIICRTHTTGSTPGQHSVKPQQQQPWISFSLQLHPCPWSVRDPIAACPPAICDCTSTEPLRKDISSALGVHAHTPTDSGTAPKPCCSTPVHWRAAVRFLKAARAAPSTPFSTTTHSGSTHHPASRQNALSVDDNTPTCCCRFL